ncbi:MAG: DUF362 domain-containing protein [Candidatus Manganitrophus sp. SA1]|nr:DUF362 domain-containing protein [Candidatus Manganitrophus morganii]
MKEENLNEESDPISPSRRSFIQMAGALLPIFIANPFNLFRSFTSPDGELRPVPHPKPNRFVQDGKALVSVVGGENIDRMVREAVDLIGGIDRLDLKGKTVLVKPNVVSHNPPPATTSPDVVRSVVKLLYEGGAGKVIVGDMSGVIRLPTRKNLKETGIEAAAREAGAEVIDFDDAEWIEVKPPQAQLSGKIYVARPVYEADLLVNVPVVKTHQSATYSICLKNLVGVTHPRNRPYRVNPARWEEVVAEMNLAAHPDLNIVDATTIMVAGGPQEGPAEKTNMIFASGDRIAADVVGLGLIKHFNRWKGVGEISVWAQRQIRYAQAIGLGIKDAASMKMITKRLEGDEAVFSALIAKIESALAEGPEGGS